MATYKSAHLLRRTFEALDDRVLPAVTASFTAAGGTLRIVGDEFDNTIVVSRDAAGTILINNGAVAIQGVPATVANTSLILVNGGAGDDSLAVNIDSALTTVAIFAGDGEDVLISGGGDDLLDGGPGNDLIFMGAGDDTAQWNPGDGSDMVEGQGGNDTLVFNGANLAEKLEISDSGAGSPVHRATVTRDLGNVAIDLNGVETVELNANGGADTITINDQTATDIRAVNLDLGGTGFGDGEADNVIVNGTAGADSVQIVAPNGGNGIVVSGLLPTVTITTAEAARDRLTVHTLAGNDVVDASGLPANLIGLTVDLGSGQTAAPRVAGVLVNGGAAQRSMVTRMQVAFNQHVTLPANPAAAFRLVRQSDGAAVALNAAVDNSGSGTVVVLTFIGGAVEGTSLADGRYTLTVLAGQVGSASGALDGNGDGASGDDFVLAGDPATNKLFRLFGDVNADAAVNGLDLTAFRAAFGTVTTGALSPFDVNGDGAINGTDLTAFRGRFGSVV